MKDKDMSNQNLVTMSVFEFEMDVEFWKGLSGISERHLNGNVLNLRARSLFLKEGASVVPTFLTNMNIYYMINSHNGNGHYSIYLK